MINNTMKHSAILIVFMVVLTGANLAFAAGIETFDYRPELGAVSPKLDIYSFDGAKDAPVLIYVHGGAWKRGRRQQVGAKPRYYNEKGYIFVSIDYRLIPKVRVEEQLEDVDHALGWIAANIGPFGGDANNLHLMGHSAGAHLVSMTGMAPQQYGRRLIDAGALRTVISNDTMTYDILRVAAARGGMLPKVYQDVFGQEAARWKRLSPQYYAGKLQKAPAFLAMFSGQRFARARKTLAESFVGQLKSAGVKAAKFDGSKYNHRQMTTLIGVDDRLTGAIDRFLESNN